MDAPLGGLGGVLAFTAISHKEKGNIQHVETFKLINQEFNT